LEVVMRRRLRSVGVFLGMVVLTLGNGHSSVLLSGQASPLRIVVVEGEDAVNVVQQKTAVAPVIEVRDRNDQPLAGVVVRFAISKGRATFNGARTLTVTTNVAGRAVATGLTPTGSGALQIGASAAFQGQTAVATIAQTNVMTLAQAAAASGAASGGAGSGGAAGGAGGAAGGGGLSAATTVGIVGGAVAGGAIAAKEVIGGGNGVNTYSGPYSGQTTDTFAVAGCTETIAHAGKVFVDIQVANDGTVTGTGGVQGTMTIAAVAAGCPAGFPALNSVQMDGCCTPNPPVQGTTSSFTWSGSKPGGASTNWTYTFTGALSGTTVTGTYKLTATGPGVVSSGGTFPVTLSKE
jgi:hypothetical protein